MLDFLYADFFPTKVYFLMMRFLMFQPGINHIESKDQINLACIVI